MSAIKFSHVALILPTQVALYECASGKLATSARGEQAALPEVLAALLAAHQPKRGARMVVVASDFFAQSVRLSTMQTTGLSGEELTTALAFEVEPFSTLSASSAALAFARGELHNGMQVWQVVQIAHDEVAALQRVARAARVTPVAFAAPGAAVLEAADVDDLSVRVGEWSRQAMTATPPFPLLDARKILRRKRDNRKVLAVGIVAILLLALVLHYQKTHRELATLKSEAQRLTAMARANREIAAANTALQAQITQHEREMAAREKRLVLDQRYRAAWTILMAGLQHATGSEVVLSSINSPDLFVAEVVAMANSETAPGDFLSRLQEAIADSGWRIHDESQQSAAVGGLSAVVTFRFAATLDLPDEVRRRAAVVVEEVW